jgi:hypothetical protein
MNRQPIKRGMAYTSRNRWGQFDEKYQLSVAAGITNSDDLHDRAVAKYQAFEKCSGRRSNF